VGISTSGNSENVVLAIDKARAIGMRTIGMTGVTGGRLAALVEVCVRVPSECTQHIQESHIALAHVMCEIVERQLFSSSGELA
jgi:D-sedoheptulose 7-phosphate isomerase